MSTPGSHFSWRDRGVRFLRAAIRTDRSKDEDAARRAGLLQVALLACMGAVLFLFAIALHDALGPRHVSTGMPLFIFVCIFLLFLGLLLLARAGREKAAAYVFTTIYFLGNVYGSYAWGASMPIGLLSYALLITLAGIVVSGRFGLLVALASFASLLLMGIREERHGVLPAWKKQNLDIEDVIAYGAMIALAAFFSWLATREVERSLRRARESESALRQERDNLEVTVATRTRAWKEAELARSVDLARFAEFGKLSAGLFHDLISPLTAISLSLHGLETSADAPGRAEAKQVIEGALRAAKRVETSLSRARKHIKDDSEERAFDGAGELRDIVGALGYQARGRNVELRLAADAHLSLFGDPIKFYQAYANLVMNGIEAHEPQAWEAHPDAQERLVEVRAQERGDGYEIIVRDTGAGMDTEAKKNIFEPFSTTKENGIGLGLTIAKDVIERAFGGTIRCDSAPDQGTLFTTFLPRRSRTAAVSHGEK